MLFADRFIRHVDSALRTMSGASVAGRPNPASDIEEAVLDDAQRRHSAGLMRVNHVGEVCAQALYQSQSRFARTESVRKQFERAGREEEDHLAWTAERLRELGSRPSLLNPLWYAGAYVLGTVAAKLGDAHSLGFVVETEHQVEAHLNDHMNRLPPQDKKSLVIVSQMAVDEVEHGNAARKLGASEVPPPARYAMRAMAKVMTSTAYYL